MFCEVTTVHVPTSLFFSLLSVRSSLIISSICRALETLSHDIEVSSRTNKFFKFFNARDDEAMVAACNRKLDSIMGDLNVSLKFFISLRTRSISSYHSEIPYVLTNPWFWLKVAISTETYAFMRQNWSKVCIPGFPAIVTIIYQF